MEGMEGMAATVAIVVATVPVEPRSVSNVQRARLRPLIRLLCQDTQA